jgi:hypothetical protein
MMDEGPGPEAPRISPADAAGIAKLVFDRVQAEVNAVLDGAAKVDGDVAGLYQWVTEFRDAVEGRFGEVDARMLELAELLATGTEAAQARERYRTQVVAEAARLGVRGVELRKMRDALGAEPEDVEAE